MGGNYFELRFVENTWHPRASVNINYPYYSRSNKVRPNPNKALVPSNLPPNDPNIVLGEDGVTELMYENREHIPFPPEQTWRIIDQVDGTYKSIYTSCLSAIWEVQVYMQGDF